MANKSIGDYTAAGSIDASADYFLVQQGGVYKKINRNTILALASAPLGTTDTQSPTNKTFDNTNALTVKATSLTIQDPSDVTKQARFAASGITAGNTRTYTLPDASTTLVGTGVTQTLTSKTLTSPTITGGTIDNSTITVDSIAGHTTATTVTVANLQIANGVLNTANAVTATSVADAAIQPKALVTGTGSGWAWSSYSPTWTNLSTGNGAVIARYIQMGKTVVGQVNLTFGSTTSVSGSISLTMPVTASGTYLTANQIGLASFFNTGTASFTGTVSYASSTTMLLQVGLASGTYVTDAVTSSTIPFTWQNGSRLAFNFLYEAA